jgi:hypothetical protein
VSAGRWELRVRIVPATDYRWWVEWWPTGGTKPIRRGRREGTAATEAQAWAAAEQARIEQERHYPDGP